MCALIAALRSVPIGRPGPPPPKLGSEERPNYTVMITDEDAARMRKEDDVKGKKKRWDFEEEDEKDVENTEEEVGEGLAQMRKAEKEARAKEEEERAGLSIGAVPPALAVSPTRKEAAGAEGARASGVDHGRFRRLMSDAGALGLVSPQQQGLGGRRKRVNIRGRDTSISGPYYNPGG